MGGGAARLMMVELQAIEQAGEEARRRMFAEALGRRYKDSDQTRRRRSPRVGVDDGQILNHLTSEEGQGEDASE